MVWYVARALRDQATATDNNIRHISTLFCVNPGVDLNIDYKIVG